MKKFQMSEKALTNTLCIAAGVMVVTVVFLSVFAMVQSSRSKKNAVSDNYSTTAFVTSKLTTTKSGTTTDSVTTGGKTTPDPKTDPDVDPKQQSVTPDDPGKDPTDISEMTFVAPCMGNLSRAYSPDKLVYSQTMNDYRSHEGIDILSNVGDDVLAVADGTVTNIYTDPMMGNCVRIDHGNGLVSVYMNLGGEIPEGVDEGMKVSGGQKIGVVGDSAAVEQSEDMHLHLAMLLNGDYVNPVDYVAVSDEEVFEG